MGRKLEKPGTIKPATPSAPAPKATAPAGGGGAAKPKAAAGGTPRNPPPPPPPPAPEQEPAVPGAEAIVERSIFDSGAARDTGVATELTPQQQADLTRGVAPGTAAEVPDMGKYRDLREKAIRRAAERRSWYDPLKRGATLASLGASNLAVPVLAADVGTAAGRFIGETINEAVTPEGRARLRYGVESRLPDWEILGKSKGAVVRNPSGRTGQELVVYPNPSVVEIGGSPAEFAANARAKEAELRTAQRGYDTLAEGYVSAASQATTPDASLGSYEKYMRDSLQRVADLRETLRRSGYSEEDIDAIK